MTVGELIAALKSYEPAADVLLEVGFIRWPLARLRWSGISADIGIVVLSNVADE